MILTGPDPTDPFMLKVHGRYYLYTSEGTSYMNVPLRIGSQLGHWGKPIDVLPHLPSWAEGGLTWAPDVQEVAGGWALYFTALLNGVNPWIHCIGSAFATSPAGPFVPTEHPFICQLDHRGSIDARVFVDTGDRLVMLWKSEDNANPSVPGPDQNGYTGIYSQDLSADGRVLLGQPVKIFAPSEPWEGTIVEAPDMVEAWGTYWMFFSGNWYYSTSYGIGVAACQSAFGPCSDPNPEPFLASNQQGAGPGESSIFRDGQNIYLLYNPFRANDPGPVIPRPIAMTRLGFNPKGPYLAAP
jgi:beta-xylosidase